MKLDLKTLSKQLTLIGFAGGALLLSGCDVDQTREGKLPDVDVSVEEGQLPAYDVDTMDVDIGSKEVEVEVPDVDVDVSMEKERFTVPDIDVEMPDDDDH